MANTYFKMNYLISTNENGEVFEVKSAFIELNEKSLRIVSNFKAKIYHSSKPDIVQVFYEDTRISRKEIYIYRILKISDELDQANFSVVLNHDSDLSVHFKTFEEAKNLLDSIENWIL